MTLDVTADGVIARLRAATKYRDIHHDTIADVVRQEAAKAAGRADLERRARRKLHKVAAGYLLTTRIKHLARGLAEVDGYGEVDGDGPALREYCRGVLGAHFSSAERLPDLERFYPTIFDVVGDVTSVADLACALNMFSLPWLREVTGARYAGYDLNLSYVELGRAFLAGRYPDCSVEHSDVLVAPESITADLALLLKTCHNIEDRTPGAGLRLVAELGSPTVVVSFPLRTKAGRAAPFTARLVAELAALGERHGWRVEQVILSSELLVFVGKDGFLGAHG